MGCIHFLYIRSGYVNQFTENEESCANKNVRCRCICSHASTTAYSQWTNASPTTTAVNVGIGVSPNQFYLNQGTLYDPAKAGIRFNNGIPVFNSKDGGVLYLNRDVNADVYIQSTIANSTKDIAVFKSTGEVGIGLTTPTYKLDVEAPVVRFKNSSASTNEYTSFRIQGTNYAYGLEIDFFGNNNFSADSYGGGVGSGAIVNVNPKPLILGTNNTARLTIDGTGNIGIGTQNTGTFKLAVEGKIGAREINVTTASPWPDYVFELSYTLPTLEQVNTYINVNKHLPEIPSANIVGKEGINLGEMNMLLLKKVEELTLYLIQQQTQLDKLKNEIIELKSASKK